MSRLIVGMALVLSAGTQLMSGGAVPRPQEVASKYSSAKYGITFQYPEGYRLEEGGLNQSRGLGYLGPIPMEYVATGGARIVTVEGGSYPGTDFVNAFLTISADEYLTEDECREFNDEASGARTPVEKKISGITFYGLEQGGLGLGHQWGGIYYHGFSEGICFELGYGIATAGYGAVDGMKKVDDGAVLSLLAGILQNVAIAAPQSGTAAAPSITSFSIAHLPSASPSNRYHIVWQVSGGNSSSEVWLSISCFQGLGEYPFEIMSLDSAGAEQDAIPCDVVRPLRSLSGSLDIEFTHMSGFAFNETVRLFVAGRPSVSKTLTVTLPNLPVINFIDLLPSRNRQPVISGVDRSGQTLFTFSERVPFSLLPDDEIGLVGFGFLPTPALWIGSTSLPMTSADNQNITFVVPTGFPEGTYPMYLTNENGKGNSVFVRISRPRTAVVVDPKRVAEKAIRVECDGGDVVVPGKQVRVEGFFLRTDVAWIGTTPIPAHWVEGPLSRFTLEFTAPDSLAPGTYPFYVTNELGKSNVGTVKVVPAR